MEILGVTGGIGAGKSTVIKIFKEKGYSVYNSDIRAKKLMEENDSLKQEIINLLGEKAYLNGSLNRSFIAQKIFTDHELLKEQNKLVHAEVKKDFKNWVSVQNGKFCIKETAILFESGSYKDCNYTLVVTAPERLRIERVMERDNIPEDKVKLRIKNQWPQEKLIKLSDFHISNDSSIENLNKQVKSIINILENQI